MPKYSSYQKVGENDPSITSSAPPQRQSSSLYDESSVDSDSFLSKLPQNHDADTLSMRLVACNDNEELEDMVLRRTLDLSQHNTDQEPRKPRPSPWNIGESFSSYSSTDRSLLQNLVALVALAMLGLILIFVFIEISSLITGPPSLPVGQYTLIELQEGEAFFDSYVFYNGKDSEGSKGYVNYVNKEKAFALNIARVDYEPKTNVFDNTDNGNIVSSGDDNEEEPFIYMSTSATAEGPRDSVRLEGLRRFNRGLFILDVRHMPAGCGTWPAFWLTDEPNWPVNGEIDILEGVNTQTRAKTAMHTTKGCDMEDVPLGVKTGYWDTASGVPMRNGDIDPTVREARDCFVYNPHQWLNQGCVAMHERNDTMGEPLNQNGGGIFVLEWDPINRLIKSWVFTPHTEVPENLKDSLQTASYTDESKRVNPDPRTWGLPYAYFPIGKGTSCDSNHFANMHLIFNLALCGSVAGNRFKMDCPSLNARYGSCDEYIKANTTAMEEVYWRIRGVYVYEREWEKSWPV